MATGRMSTLASLASIPRYQLTASILPRLFTSAKARPWSASSILTTSISIPAISITIPGFLADIWEGILKAVPKKKTSHMKKRHRQMAGKALKDVNAVNTCPGCGKPKKAHTLCPYCVAEIRESWKQAAKQALK